MKSLRVTFLCSLDGVNKELGYDRPITHVDFNVKIKEWTLASSLLHKILEANSLIKNFVCDCINIFVIGAVKTVKNT